MEIFLPNYYYYYYYLSPLSQSLLVSFRSSAGCIPCTWASDTQVIHSDHTLSTFLRIRADPSMLIFWVSVTLALFIIIIIILFPITLCPFTTHLAESIPWA